MRRAGWAVHSRRPLAGPTRSVCGSQPAPRTLLWRVASPDGSEGLNAGVPGLWYKSFRNKSNPDAELLANYRVQIGRWRVGSFILPLCKPGYDVRSGADRH